MAKIGEYYAQIGVHGLAQYQAAFASAKASMQQLAASTEKAIAQSKQSWLGLGAITRRAGPLLAAAGVSYSVGSMLQMSAEAESLAASFEVMLGSAEKAQATLKELRDFAAATPFSIGGLSEATKTLLGFGLSAEDAVRSVKMLSDVAMGNEEKLRSLALVFGQIAAAGKLSGGDLLQLINAGFNPLEVISKQTGKSIAKLREEMSQGKITFDMVRRAFEAAAGPGGRFYQMNEKMSRTLAGRWSTFKDALVGTLRSVGDVLVDAFDLKDVLAGASSFLEGLAAKLKTFWAQWGPTVKQALATLLSFFKMLWSAMSGLLGAIASLFGSIFGASGLTVKAFQESFVHYLKQMQFFFENWKLYLAIGWEQFKLWCSNLWERIKTFFQNVWIVLRWLYDNWINIFVDIWNATKTIFANLAENLKNLWTALLNWIKGKGWSFDWTPLLDGFQSTVSQMPELMEAQIQETTPALELLRKELEEARREFFAEKKPAVKQAAPAASAAAAAAAQKEGKLEVKFIGLAELARQMQEEVGKKTEEQIAANTGKTAEAVDRLAAAAAGDALRVQVVGGLTAAYA